MPPRRAGFRYPAGTGALFGRPPRGRTPPGPVIPPVIPALRAGSYAPGKMRWGPVARPIGSPPVQAYGRKLTGIPLQGGQASGLVPASGALTLSVGPQGYGTVWYPASLAVSTTLGLSGAFDTSTAYIYLGPAGVTTPQFLQGSIYSGNGVLAVALPPITPGLYLTVVWAGATSGNTAAVNVTGTMDAVSG